MAGFCRLVLWTLVIFLEVSAQREDRVPDRPENVRIRMGSETANIWWEAPSTADQILVRGFTLSFGVETPSETVVIEGVNTNAFTLNNLRPNTTYVFILRAYNEAPGEDSEPVILSATTEPHFMAKTDIPKPPTKIDGIGISPSEVQLYWIDPNAETKSHFFSLEFWNIEETERKTITTTSTKAIISALEPNQKYAFRLRIINGKGEESEWSEIRYVRTPAESKQNIGSAEKCDFESPDQCDYVSDANSVYEWTRVPTENGHSMRLEADGKTSGSGRLLSPIFSFPGASRICVALQYIVAPLRKFRLSVLEEGGKLIPLFENQMEKLPRGVWQRLSVESRIRQQRGFQIQMEAIRTDDRFGFRVNVDNVAVVAGVCPNSQRHFGNVSVNSKTNISLWYTDSSTESSSKILASFGVPSFVEEWGTFALEVEEESVTLFFRCSRISTIPIRRQPLQLQMDDASKLYIGSGGPIVGAGFEGSIQELRLTDDPAEAARQCDDQWNVEGSAEPMETSTTRRSMPLPTTPQPSTSPFRGSDFPSEPFDDSLIIPYTHLRPFLSEYGIRAEPSWNSAFEEKNDESQRRTFNECKCEKGPMGPQGPPGPPFRLSSHEIQQIVRTAGIKGEKGECIQNYQQSPQEYQISTKPDRGPKGDRGERGPIGMSGPPGPPGPPAFAASASAATANRLGDVRVFQTTVELLSSAPQSHIGILAFSLSDQELFIRVNNGWQNIPLGRFVAAMERRPTAKKDPIGMALPPMDRDVYDFRDVAPDRHKRLHLIALNSAQSGDIGGVRGADLLCYREARAAGFGTTFRAFLSSRVQNLNQMVYPDDRNAAVVNLNGEIIFNSWRNIFDGMAKPSASILSFDGRNIEKNDEWPEKWIWHGSSASGDRADGNFCDSWRSLEGMGMGSAWDGRGTPIAVPRPLPCRHRFAVLCVENMSRFNVDRRVGKRIPGI